MKNTGGAPRDYTKEELETMRLFGRVVRKTRKLLHISQDTLAVESQLSQNYISKLESFSVASRNFETAVAFIIEGFRRIWQWDCLKGSVKLPFWIKAVQKKGVFKSRFYFEKFLEENSDFGTDFGDF